MFHILSQEQIQVGLDSIKKQKRLRISRLIMDRYNFKKEFKEYLLLFYPFDSKDRKELSQWLTYHKKKTKKKNTIDVNIKLTDLEQFKDLINLLKENIDSLPTELKDKLSEILEK